MERLKAIIIDDESASIETLKILLSRFCEDVDVVATATSAKKAVKLINDSVVDVVFLDIMMPDGTGFDVLEQMPNRNFEVVFITAYNNLEIKALKYSAIKFLQKPISKEQLMESVEAMKARKGIVFNATKRYSALFENLKAVLPKILSLQTADSFEYIEIDKILAFKGDNKIVNVYIDGEQEIVTKEKIDHLEDILYDRKFYRFNTFLLVNMKNIEIMTDFEIILKGGMSFPINSSRIYEFKLTYGNPPYH